MDAADDRLADELEEFLHRRPSADLLSPDNSGKVSVDVHDILQDRRCKSHHRASLGFVARQLLTQASTFSPQDNGTYRAESRQSTERSRAIGSIHVSSPIY